jgi:hypothetical protein
MSTATGTSRSTASWHLRRNPLCLSSSTDCALQQFGSFFVSCSEAAQGPGHPPCPHIPPPPARSQPEFPGIPACLVGPPAPVVADLGASALGFAWHLTPAFLLSLESGKHEKPHKPAHHKETGERRFLMPCIGCSSGRPVAAPADSASPQQLLQQLFSPLPASASCQLPASQLPASCCPAAAAALLPPTSHPPTSSSAPSSQLTGTGTGRQQLGAESWELAGSRCELGELGAAGWERAES